MKYEITIIGVTRNIVKTNSQQAVELAIAAYYTDQDIYKLIIIEDNKVIFSGEKTYDKDRPY